MTVMTFISRLSAPATPLKHTWEHTVGSGHALLALRADWQQQLHRCRDELGFRHVRFHGLLSDEMGTLISHQDKPLYSFFNADRICDFLLSIGMRPFVELGFMPEMLASGPDTVFHYRGNVTPPADYAAWATFIRKLAGHWVEHHGIATQHVEIRLSDAPAPLAATLERIDEDYANPRRCWREMGEPEYPSRLQVEQLEAASRLTKEPLGFAYENRTVRFDIDLPPHAVAAVTLAFAPQPPDAGAAP